MNLRALLVLCLGLAVFTPAYSKTNRPESNNPNVKRALKKPKKNKARKYKAPKKAKKANFKPRPAPQTH